jgi:hypothetical protein
MSAALAAELSSNPEHLAMTRYPLFLVPVLGGAVLLLSGALKQKPVLASPILIVDAAQPADAEATERVSAAVAALAPEQVQWLECKLWQQGMCEDFTFQACGRLLTAPGQRSRIDVNLKVGGTVGELRQVCDGKTAWQSLRLGDEANTLTQLEGPEQHGRAVYLGQNGISGPAATLSHLREKMRGTRCTHQRWKDQDVFVIAGALPCIAAGEVEPRFQARQAVLYLDATSLWPLRIEWWGNDRDGKPLQLLQQTEFRDPVVNQPLSGERCAAEFAKPQA